MKHFYKFSLLIICGLLSLPIIAKDKDINGKYVYIDENNSPLYGVKVFLKDLKGNIIDKTITNVDGEYKFNKVPEGEYIISADYDQNFSTVDLQDLLAIRNHILGIKEISGFYLKTADVNGDGNIDWKDYNYFLIDYFLENMDFPDGKWEFETRAISQSYFSDLKVGEDDGDSFGGEEGETGYPPPPPPPPPGGLRDAPLADHMNIEYNGIIDYNNSNYYEIPIYLNKNINIEGFGLIFNYNKNLIEIEDIVSDFEDIHYEINNGQIRISWFNSSQKTISSTKDRPIFYLKSYLKDEKTNTNELFNINKKSQIISADGDLLKDITVSMPMINTEIEQSELQDIYPNPVRSQSTIEYRINDNCDVNLSIFNNAGQKLAELVNTNQSPGIYQVQFDVNNLNLLTGTYIYRLICNGETYYTKSKILIVSK